MKIGFATPEGTCAYARRLNCATGHFRTAQGLLLSSIGIGTYLGENDEATDAAYTISVGRSIQLGVNVIDTAINYRFQRSERSIGAALRGVARQEVFVSTKAGFLTPDGVAPANPRAYFEAEYLSCGVMRREDIVQGMHCMAPSYLEDQLDRSRRNLDLETIDLFYLHNPVTQPGIVGPEVFAGRLRAAFELLESKVAAGVIRWYGAATWNGFRSDFKSPDHLSLESMVEIARGVGGDSHHFRFIQLPLNLALPEALFSASQTLGGKPVSVLEAAGELGITVMASGSLAQGQLTVELPEHFRSAFANLETDAQRALQFTRCAPGVTTALVGMSKIAHVEENLRLAKVAPTRMGL